MQCSSLPTPGRHKTTTTHIVPGVNRGAARQQHVNARDVARKRSVRQRLPRGGLGGGGMWGRVGRGSAGERTPRTRVLCTAVCNARGASCRPDRRGRSTRCAPTQRACVCACLHAWSGLSSPHKGDPVQTRARSAAPAFFGQPRQRPGSRARVCVGAHVFTHLGRRRHGRTRRPRDGRGSRVARLRLENYETQICA